jgi:hypothetical protein
MFLGLNQRTRGPLFLLSIQLTAVGTETYIQIRAPIVRGSLRIYRNGVLQTIAQATLGVGNVVTLGTPASTGDVYFVEYLSHANVRFPASLPTVVTDPYFANLISLLHYNGTNGSTTFTDQIGGTTWTATNATLDTSTKQFGTASGKFSAGANSHILINTSAGFAIGTSADYCVEFWANGNSLTGDVCAFDCRDPGSGYVGTSVYLSASSTSNKPAVINSAAAIIASGASFPGGWNFCVLERYSGTLYFYINSTQIGTAADSQNTTFSGTGTFGNSIVFSQYVNGYIDESRITKHARYFGAGSITVPTAPFPDI